MGNGKRLNNFIKARGIRTNGKNAKEVRVINKRE